MIPTSSWIAFFWLSKTFLPWVALSVQASIQYAEARLALSAAIARSMARFVAAPSDGTSPRKSSVSTTTVGAWTDVAHVAVDVFVGSLTEVAVRLIVAFTSLPRSRVT